MIKYITKSVLAGLMLFLASQISLLNFQPVLAETPAPIISSQTAQTATISNTAVLSHTAHPTYTVQAGDIPLKIAARFDIPVETLLAANLGLEPTRLQIGQVLQIPGEGSADNVSIEASFVYSIQAGDSLLALAGRYNISLANLLAMNPGIEPTRLQIGQEITIPGANQPLKGAAEITTQPLTETSAYSNATFLAQTVLNAVNAQRAQVNLPPYEPDVNLAQVARAHAEDMINRGYFSHNTPEGVTLRNRLEANGLLANWVGENIQRNTRPPEQTVQRAINWFMSSSAHRNNLLHAHYTRLGVGVVEGPPGWYTYVLVFSE